MYLRRITDDEYNSLCRKNIRECISKTTRFNQNKCSLDYVKDDMYLESDDSDVIQIITNYNLIRAPLEYHIKYNCIDEINSWQGFEIRYNSLINREQLAHKLSVFLNNDVLILDITKYIINIVIGLI